MATNTTPQQPKDKPLRFAGDVIVDYCNIVSNNGKVLNIINQISSIEIFEDIFSPVISGQITVMESFNFIEKLPFIGEETLEMRIYTPEIGTDNRNIIEGKWYVYKITNRENIADKRLFYVIHFTSIESVIDTNIKISKVYGGKINDIVTQLCQAEGLTTPKNINIQKTRNDVRYISNFWTPLQNIQYLTKRAVSDTLAADYLFYENRFGFNFVSLENLYQQNEFYEYFYDDLWKVNSSVSMDTNISSDFKRIRSLGVDTGFDYLSRIQHGYYGSKMVSYDLITKKYMTQHLRAVDDFPNSQHLNEFPAFTPNVIQRDNALIVHHPKYYGNFNGIGWDHSNLWAQKHIMQLQQATSTVIKVLVPGRTDITCGQKVNVQVGNTEAISKTEPAKQAYDLMYSGKYIISAINHEITRERHSMNMELIKDSVLFAATVI